MKLTSFRTSGNVKSYGIYQGKGIVDLGRRLGSRYPDLKALLAAEALHEAIPFRDCVYDFAADEVTFLPVIPKPDKILCIGMNYAAMREAFHETDSAPTLFVRFPDSQTGHGCGLIKPSQSDEFDFEGELAVIIGKGGFRISAEHALAHVAGYSCYMDGSVRNWQHAWYTAGKNWRGTGAFGPYLVTADEIPDPQSLAIRTLLNGEVVQNDNTANMIYSVAQLIEYLSTFTELAPGDVIITGSPGGVGKTHTPPRYLKVGDRVEVEIEHIGCLRSSVIAPS